MSLPKHVAIVMDGNGRWATRRHMPRFMGHKSGAKVVRSIAEHAAKKGIGVLTLFAFGLENQSRPQTEISFLMSLLQSSLQKNVSDLNANNVRLRVIGERSFFDEKLKATITEAERQTKKNTGLTLVVAIHYSGRWDILQATKKVARQVEAGHIKADDVDDILFKNALCLADLPDPDLFIRTSGEQRISNFLLWQCAYAEIYFTPVFWPDFSESEFDAALEFYATRQRRFGKTPEQISEKTLEDPHYA